jgi:hypothetical protein
MLCFSDRKSKDREMATIEIIIRDDEGNIINEKTKREHKVDIGNGRFHNIEGAVEVFKKEVLADIEADLLISKQSRYVEDKKKDKR